MAKKDEPTAGAAPEVKNELTIQKIYMKDCSFEAPNAPGIFRLDWQPEVNFELASDSSKMEGDEGLYEVVLRITVTAKIQQKIAFLMEVHQAGIFTVKEFNEEQMKYIFGSICPSILFPYARETIASGVSHGGFPQLNLAPINFDAVFAQQMQKQQEESDAKNAGDAVLN